MFRDKHPRTLCPYCDKEVVKGTVCEHCGRFVSDELPPMRSVIRRWNEPYYGLFGEATYFCQTCRSFVSKAEIQIDKCPKCNTHIKVEYPKTKTVVAICSIISAICLYLTIRHPFLLPLTVPTLIAFLFVLILGLVIGLR
jgi:hypothetical protein